MLLQELSHLNDFVKVDPPECIETKGLMNGENMFYLKCPINLSSHLGLTATICIKPTSIDRIISKSIKEFGAWEPKYVNSILKMAERFPDATFLGCVIIIMDLLISTIINHY